MTINEIPHVSDLEPISVYNVSINGPGPHLSWTCTSANRIFELQDFDFHLGRQFFLSNRDRNYRQLACYVRLNPAEILRCPKIKIHQLEIYAE